MVVLVDEVAFLTAYHPDKQLRERVKAALATLTTQGRAVGYCVVAALQDPRKEVMSIRNLFPDRIAMRLDEPEQVDMVLGDGARDRGATADLISSDPPTAPGWRSSGWNPTPTRCGSAPPGWPTRTSGPWPRHAAMGMHAPFAAIGGGQHDVTCPACRSLVSSEGITIGGDS